MTDEEKAEEKYQEHINKERCYISKPEEEIYTDGFLDGLAEGRKEKWHDLMVNPNDLPKKDGTYLVSISLSNQIVTDTHEYRDGYFSKHLRIIAWCELPKFEE